MRGTAYDVFLGGSCGLTSWRQDKVIPYLDKFGLTYYNPQKSSWTADCIELEERAKKNSRVLLFVIHPETISATSFIEICYLAGSGAPLVVVLPPKARCLEIAYCARDREDREKALEFLDLVLVHHKVPCFETVEQARDSLRNQFISKRALRQALNDPHCRWHYLRLKLFEMRTVWSPKVARSGWSRLSRVSALARQLSRQSRPKGFTEWAQMSVMITELTLLLVLIFLCPHLILVLVAVSLLVCHLITWVLSSYFGRRQRMRRQSAKSRPASYDLFIGGSGLGADLDWISQKAIPYAQKRGVSFVDGALCTEWDKRRSVVESCSQVVYRISSQFSWLSGSSELAYWMGRKRSVIACVSDSILSEMPVERSVCVDEKAWLLHQQAVFRSLQYLKDIAIRSDVHIYDSVEQTLQYAISKVFADTD